MRELHMSIRYLAVIAIVAAVVAPRAAAHPQVQNALDAVIHPDKVVLDVRVMMEQVMLVERAPGATADRWSKLVAAHGAYLTNKLFVKADGVTLDGRVTAAESPQNVLAGASAMATYRIEYPIAKPPTTVEIRQGLLEDFPPWTATFAGRIRQSTDATFDAALLTAQNAFEYKCDWTAKPATTQSTSVASAAVGGLVVTATRVDLWTTFREYFAHGVHHILTGYDHLLFVAALVLAARKLWDLVWVVSGFTLAHTLTLTLSVCFKSFSLSEHIVEPMIAASIVFVASQNVIAPRTSRGPVRLAIAFGFGLFHGLGFAGGLKEAMAAMPGTALGAALGGFSVGVEVGHQVVVLPLFALLYGLRYMKAPEPRTRLMERLLRVGSCAISVAGVYFLVEAVK